MYFLVSGVTPAEIAGVGAVAGVSFFLDTPAPAKKIRVKNEKNQQIKAKN
jgi:hypothetical protein